MTDLTKLVLRVFLKDKCGFGTITMEHPKSFNGKKVPSARGIGVVGGSVGPMTVTNAHIDHCVAVAQRIIQKLQDNKISYTVEPSYYNSSLSRIKIPVGPKSKKQSILVIDWSDYPRHSVECGYDRAYRTIWFEATYIIEDTLSKV